MAVLNHENPFQAWVMTEKEQLEGACLTLAQKQLIQNQIAQISIERIHLEFDVNNPQKFIQEDSYKKGYLAALQYLIDLSAASEDIISNIAKLSPQ